MKENLKVKLTKPDLKESSFWKKPIEGKPFALTKIKGTHSMNKKAQMQNLMIGLLFAFIIITTLVALIPGFVSVLDIGMDPSGLNCQGGVNYNATLGERSTVGCLGFKLIIPYLVLSVLIGVVSKILYDKGQQPSYNPYG